MKVSYCLSLNVCTGTVFPFREVHHEITVHGKLGIFEKIERPVNLFWRPKVCVYTKHDTVTRYVVNGKLSVYFVHIRNVCLKFVVFCVCVCVSLYIYEYVTHLQLRKWPFVKGM